MAGEGQGCAMMRGQYALDGILEYWRDVQYSLEYAGKYPSPYCAPEWMCKVYKAIGYERIEEVTLAMSKLDVPVDINVATCKEMMKEQFDIIYKAIGHELISVDIEVEEDVHYRYDPTKDVAYHVKLSPDPLDISEDYSSFLVSSHRGQGLPMLTKHDVAVKSFLVLHETNSLRLSWCNKIGCPLPYSSRSNGKYRYNGTPKEGVKCDYDYDYYEVFGMARNAGMLDTLIESYSKYLNTTCKQ